MNKLRTVPELIPRRLDLNYAYDFRLQGARFKRGLLSTGELLEQLRPSVNSFLQKSSSDRIYSIHGLDPVEEARL